MQGVLQIQSFTHKDINVVDTTKKFNHISLCTGYGGIDLGLSRVIPNLRTIAFCEIELYPIQNLVAKMEKGMLPPTPIWSDVKTFPFKDFSGKVDVLSGGFPCQPFSEAGRKKADDDPRHIFPYFKMGIELCRPAFIFLENVKGIISSTINNDGWNDPKGTPILLHVCRELERIGYRIVWNLYTAIETGLPHLRHRVFILGTRTDIDQSQLREFSKYFQNNTTEYRTENTTISLQKEIENIESRYVAIPNRRTRRQYFYEPKRIIRSLVDTEQERTFSSQPNTITEESREQETWETKRFEKTTDVGLSSCTNRTECEQTTSKSTMGRDADGSSDWLDYERLCNSFSSIQDEIALLGNGVVPATAETAFRDLFQKLLD
jgi:DNA-cytosine methyltransferase